MANNMKKVLLTPRLQKIMTQVGEQIYLARKRRKLSTEIVAKRAGISRATLWKIEKGNGSVAFGFYLKVLHAMNLEKEFLHIAADDDLGRFLQDAEYERKRKES